MIDSANSGDGLEATKDRIRVEVARRKQQIEARTSPSDAVESRATDIKADSRPLRIGSMRRRPLTEPMERIEGKDSYALSDLLDFHDEQFITNAYRAILRREPDSEGSRRYLDGLRVGELSKQEILGRLRYSQEGRSHHVNIAGLLPSYALHRAFRVPGVGYLLALASHVMRLPAIDRRMRRLEALLRQGEMEFARHADEMADTVERAMELLERKAEATALTRVASEIASLQQRKADLTAIAPLAEGIRALHEGKADDTAIEPLANEINLLRQSKADLAALEPLAKEIQALQQGKASAPSLAALVNEISELDKRKVDTAQLVEVSARIAQFEAIGAEVSSNERYIDAIKDQLLAHARSIVDQQRRLAEFLDEVRKRLGDGAASERGACVPFKEDHLHDAFYAAFEDRFRGSREEIKERVAVYLPIMQAAAAGTENAPILDVGCGRGEWLELLREHGLTASGVDSNRVMVERCRNLGLEVFEADVLSWLRSLEERTLGAVTGFHIIEHLPYPTLIALFDETMRVLKPGGVAVYETPNPENLIVAACNFYYDPTHRQPLPPEPTRFLAEARGFERVEIKRLHPMPVSEAVAAELGGTTLSQWFTSAQDYSIIGYKKMR